MSRKKKKNKKKNTLIQQKAFFKKHEKAQYILFFQKLNAIANALGLDTIVDEIPEAEKTLLYRIRFHPPKIQRMEGLPIPNRMLKAIQCIINDFLEENSFCFPNTNQKFSFLDYFTVVLSTYHWLASIPEVKIGFPTYDYFKEAFKPLLDYCELEENPEKELTDYCDMMGYSLSIPHKRIFFLWTSMISRTTPRNYFATSVVIGMDLPKKKIINFDGHNRTVYSLFYLKNGRHKAKIKAGNLQTRSILPDMELDLYFQKHALERLQERLDCIDLTLSLAAGRGSFKHPEIIPDPSDKMRALLTYRLFGQKLGYFVLEVKEGIAVMRTFLFLTNDSTPEGQKLKTHLSISKLDKVYNRLDKLSTFVMSDIQKDKELRHIMEVCDCGSLFKIRPEIVDVFGLAKQEGIPSAKTIKKYLMLTKK